MRILMTAHPMFGHVNTVLPIAEAASRAGHEVVIATGSSKADLLTARGISSWEVGPSAAPSGQGTDWIAYFGESAAQRAVDLVPLADDWRPDLVIHEETELAGAVVSARLGVPEVVHGLGVMPGVETWAVVSPGLVPVLDRWATGTSVARVREAQYLEVAPPSLRLPGERLWSRVQPVRHRPGPAAAGEVLPPEIGELPFDRLVHVTLGTVFHQADDVLATVVSGLVGIDANLVVTAGPGATATTLGEQPDHVFVASYLPHELLLPRCDLVVSHGGAGALLGGLAAGVPQLVLPQGGDQHVNAAAASAAGAAVTLLGEEVTEERVRSSASSLLSQQRYVDAATAVAAEMRAMPTADEALAAVVARVETGHVGH